ncbi:MAG: 50S ribosomal protein L17 [Deltaproteobacteria bacterium]|nr:50S ribosomal protein L17 [Deltaproteobacteria bacterium]MCB9487795.1 50S ribosomal protein L17 [Deltaproteobacteria bacterium]
MRHLNSYRQLGRNSSHRKAMFRNMATSLLATEDERIRTTEAKAKELRRVVERLITLGKRYHALGEAGEDKAIAAKKLHLHRQALAYLHDKKAVERALTILAARYEERPGGYTRIIKVGSRVGDSAPMAIIELIPEDEPAKSDEKKTRRRRSRRRGAETAGATQAPAPKATAPAPAEEPVAADEPVEEVAAEETAAEDTAVEETAAEAPVEEAGTDEEKPE